ncbi:MAG TPA: TetR/AcrR family transcriptional regulator [Acidimicrobiales bacterium]|jgi:AcrR family transcriptional regulator
MSTRLPAAARREQLLNVALEVFARQGFHGTAMNDVAEAAGVTKPVLYQHFQSKRQLYLALLDEVGQRLRQTIEKAGTDSGGPRAQVEAGFRAYFRWVRDDRDSFLLLFGSGARRDEEFAEAVRSFEIAIADTIAPLIQADIDPDHQRLLAHALVGLAEGTSRRLLALGGDFDPEQVAAQVADLAWAGLRGVRRI